MSHEGLEVTASQPLDRKELLLEQFNEVEAAPKVAEPLEVKPAGERPRDEQGKFAPKDKAPAVQAAADAGSPAVDQSANQPPVWDKPPQSWGKEFADIWKNADPKFRERAYQREEQMRAGVEPLLPRAQLADQITKAAEPYMNTIRGMGLELPAAVEGLMKVDHELRTLAPEQKVQKLLGLAQYYGINLTGAQQQAQPGIADPNFYAIQNEVIGLKGELASWKQQQEQNANQEVLREINSFAAKAEFFEEARPAMIQLIQSGLAENLPDAYEKAIRLDPQLSETVAARKQAETVQASVIAKDQAAKSARRAAVSVRSATPGSLTTTKAQDRRSKLIEQFDGLSERL